MATAKDQLVHEILSVPAAITAASNLRIVMFVSVILGAFGLMDQALNPIQSAEVCRRPPVKATGH
jgi:hypothetical protein